MKDREAHAFRKKIEQASAFADDVNALEMVELFPPWKVGITVNAGERYQHDGTLYKCLQMHRTQADWTPDITPALWVVVSVEEYPEWVQPIGAADAYQIGDKVSYSGNHWISTVNNNVWKPGVFGWNEYMEG